MQYNIHKAFLKHYGSTPQSLPPSLVSPMSEVCNIRQLFNCLGSGALLMSFFLKWLY